MEPQERIRGHGETRALHGLPGRRFHEAFPSQASVTEIFKSKRGEGRGLGRANLVLDAGECALGARRVAHGTLQEACARGAEEGGRHLAWELRGRERPSWKRHHTTSTATRRRPPMGSWAWRG